EPGGRFGSALAASFSGARSNGSANLIVGAPSAGRGGARPTSGAVYAFGHGASRSFPLLDQVYGAASGDRLGAAVAGGSINSGTTGDMIPDFAALAPGASGSGASAGAGAVYAVFGQ